MNRPTSSTRAKPKTNPKSKPAPPRPELGECWLDIFEGPTFQGAMQRTRGPCDLAIGKRGVGSIIVGPNAAVIAIGHCNGGSAADGKMLLQFRPRQIVEDFKKIRGFADIEWLRILELPVVR